jgi:hypothetical protein
MRPESTRPARGGREPSPRPGSTRLRVALSTAFAAVIGLVPAVCIASPALAVDIANGDVTITDVEAAEGDSLVFEIRRAAGTGSVSFEVDTVDDGDAVEGVDYTGYHQVVTFTNTTPGGADQIKRITVRGIADTRDEDDFENFHLVLSDPLAALTDVTAEGILDDDDAAPTYSLSTAASVSEGVGTTNVTATLSAASNFQIVIPVKTTAGTATAGQDYTALGGAATITVNAGSLTGSVPVTILDDTKDEADTQAFDVEYDASRPGTLAPSGHISAGSPTSATVTINDNDALPTITVADAGQVAEGSQLHYAISLTPVSERTVTVKVNTGPGSTDPATAGTDYTAVVDQTVTFNPGTTSQQVDVNTTNDLRDELTPESVTLTASDPTLGQLGSPAAGTGTITDDDVAPTATLSVPAITEGNSGSTTATFHVTLDQASELSTTVSYSFGGGTATIGAGKDYTGTAGSVTFAPGDTDKTFTATILGDTIDEGASETFEVTLGGDANVASAGSIGVATLATISDDDAAPTFSVANVSHNEGNPSGGTTTRNETFTITLLNTTSANTIDFTAAMVAGTAVDTGTTPGTNDYDAPAGTVQIPALATSVTVTVPINLDTVYEADETATLNVALAGGETDATGALDASTLTLVNDDAAPSIALNTESGSEGTDISVVATVTGVAQADTVFNLTFSGDSSGSNNAAETSDYVDSGVNGTIPGGTATNSTVTLRSFRLSNDTIDEPVETVKVVAHDIADNAADATGLYKINDDPGDLPPSVSISDETVDEQDGSANAQVSLTFGGDTTATERDVVVNYTTQNGSARAGSDYTAKTGQLTIAAGDSSGLINVLVTDDNLDEPDQDFTVHITAVTPAEAEITDSSATVEIDDEDATVAPTIVAASGRIGSGPVTITGRAREGAQVQLSAAAFADGNDYNVMAYTTADANGNYTFTRYVDTGYRFYTRANSISSSIKTFRIVNDPYLTGGSTAKGSVTLRVVGDPNEPNLPVQIQRANANGSWTTVATGRTTAKLEYVRTFTGLKSKTSMTFRAYIAGDPNAGTLNGFSNVKVVGIR